MIRQGSRAHTPALALALALALAAVLPLAGDAVRAEDAPAELVELFPYEADILVDDAGLVRLPLPPTVLAACRPDLSDLRIFDGAGREVPFLIDAGPARPAEARTVVRLTRPEILEARREERLREDRPSLRREIFDLRLPQEVASAAGAELVVEVPRREFVARVRVERLDARDGTAAPLAAGSLFRLEGAARAEKLRLPLPAFDGDRLRVTFDSEGESWLEPGLRLRARRDLREGTRIAVPLDVLAMRSVDGRTEIELDRPPGIVPDRLRLETETTTFDRVVEVLDAGPTAADGPLGRGRLFRVELDPPVGEDEVDVRPARGARLRLTVEDGDSPPLETPRVLAIVRQPVLVLGLVRHEGAILRFGGGRAHAPRYDLSNLLPAPERALDPDRAEAAIGLFAPDAGRRARLGEPRDNPRYDGAPALAFAMRPAAEAETALYRFRRALAVPDAPEGLTRWTLQPADLAALDPSLGDLRVVDASGRQWPYLLQRDAVETRIPVAVEVVPAEPGVTVWEFRPADAPLAIEALTLDVGATYFDRPYELSARRGDAAVEMRRSRAGRLQRPIGDRRPVDIPVGARVDVLRLEVRDGDDAPLDLRGADARVRLPRLYVTAPAGDYALLLDAARVRAPEYDLERVRDVVLAVRAAEALAGPLEPNPDHDRSARWLANLPGETLLVWGALLLAVVVLGGLTLRLARRESGKE